MEDNKKNYENIVKDKEIALLSQQIKDDFIWVPVNEKNEKKFQDWMLNSK